MVSGHGMATAARALHGTPRWRPGWQGGGQRRATSARACCAAPAAARAMSRQTKWTQETVQEHGRARCQEHGLTYQGVIVKHHTSTGDGN